MRIVAKGLLCVTVAILVLLGTLILAGNASAAEPVTEPVQEVAPPVEPIKEQTKEVVPPVEPVQEVAPPAEPIKEQTKEVVPPVEPVQEVAPPAEPIKEQTKEVAPPVEPIKEQTKEVAPPVRTTEPVVEGLPPSPSAAPQDATPPDESSGPAAAEVPSALIGPLTTDPAAVDLEEPSAASATSPVSIDAPSRLTAAQCAGDLSCEFSGLAGPVPNNCITGWLGGQSFLAASTVEFTTGAVARRGVPAGDGYDDSEGGSHSVSPPPGPAPSGTFGGSATGGSGIALSGFSTLAGLLHLVPPRAMSRLRLSCQPWLEAFFVLIPERPG